MVIKYTLLILLFPVLLFSANIVEVKPLTSSILMVHFDEGYIDYHQNGEEDFNDVVISSPLDIVAASLLNNYQLSSINDSNYSTAASPLAINRKSKGTDFASYCEAWNYLPFFDVIGCDNTSIDHAKEHWLYLSLPNAMVSGKTYELSIDPSFLSGQSSWNFAYEENYLQSDAIHVNNLGYTNSAGLKFAYVYHWMGDGGSLDLSAYSGNSFHLLDLSSGSIAFSGSATFRKDEFTVETFQNNPGETPNQNFLGAEVYECDFSGFSDPGIYRLYVEGIGASHDFEISCDAIRPAFDAVMKGLYQNRSGIALEEPYTTQPRPAPHNPATTPGFADKLKFTTTTICDVSDPEGDPSEIAIWEAGILGDLTDTWGWYQDAGDWDAYLRHMDVPVKLLFTYEHFEQNFTDNDLAIPESGNGIPDVLDEARWLIRFYKRLKDETESKGWTTGGVPGSRVFPDLWGGDLGPTEQGRGSWEDNDRWWLVSGEDILMSYYYAATSAHLAWLYDRDGLTDPEGIDWESEAINAIAWANANYDANLTCFGRNAAVLKNYASASVYRLTNVASYNADFISSWNDLGFDGSSELSGENGYGAYIYANIPLQTTDATILADAKMAIEGTADFILLANVDQRSCRWAGNHYFPMLVGQGTTPYVFEGIMGYATIKNSNPTKASNYLNYLHTTADYFLGTNPLGMTWISGVGEKSPQNIFVLDSWYNGFEEPRMGVIPYGPWTQDALTNIGPYHHQWAEKTIYPAIENWPGHERWFHQRQSPLSAEFTIDQNYANAASLYGALRGETDCIGQVSNVANVGLSVDCIEIFPNPNNGIFTIKGKLMNFDLEVLDASGNVVFVLNNQYNEANVSLNSLPSGIYFVRVINQSNNLVSLEKIIKMN